MPKRYFQVLPGTFSNILNFKVLAGPYKSPEEATKKPKTVGAFPESQFSWNVATPLTDAACRRIREMEPGEIIEATKSRDKRLHTWFLCVEEDHEIVQKAEQFHAHLNWLNQGTNGQIAKLRHALLPVAIEEALGCSQYHSIDHVVIKDNPSRCYRKLSKEAKKKVDSILGRHRLGKKYEYPTAPQYVVHFGNPEHASKLDADSIVLVEYDSKKKLHHPKFKK